MVAVQEPRAALGAGLQLPAETADRLAMRKSAKVTGLGIAVVGLAMIVSSYGFNSGDGFRPIDSALPVEQIDFVGTLDNVDVQGPGLPRSRPTAGNHLGGPNGPTTIGPGEINLADGRSFQIVSATAGTDCASISISTPAKCTVLGQVTNQNVKWIMLTPDINVTVKIDGESVSLLSFGAISLTSRTARLSWMHETQPLPLR